jgi:hypothetical protein
MSNPKAGNRHRWIELVELIESSFANAGILSLVHSGKEGDNPDQMDTPSFYTRVYRMKLDGDFIDTWVRFKYNLRDGWADFYVSFREPAIGTDPERVKKEQNSRRLLQELEKSTKGEQNKEDTRGALVQNGRR